MSACRSLRETFAYGRRNHMRNIGSQIETPRLLLRPSLLSDTANLFEFLGDKEAMRHTHVDATPAACRRRIAVHEWQRRRDGYAPWTVIRKDDAKIIGWGGLYDDPFEPGWGCEIGYFFHRDAWGCGYASELVTAALRLADRELRIREVRAFAHPDNAASRKILEMAGFRMVRFVPEMNRLLLSRPGREDDTANRS
ncbi:GNAT family N-acetyltransferase [Rhizobium dioscoreae]|nr:MULTISPECIES: GNAT family N-acetyltransferase [Rhizobium]